VRATQQRDLCRQLLQTTDYGRIPTACHDQEGAGYTAIKAIVRYVGNHLHTRGEAKQNEAVGTVGSAGLEGTKIPIY
jgi:hypothetical protein